MLNLWESIEWGSPQWQPVALGAAGLLILVGLWNLVASRPIVATALFAFLFRMTGIALLLLTLLNPQRLAERPRPRANLFPVVVDQSQSMTLRSARDQASRGESVQQWLAATNAWHARLSQDFDVRKYQLSSRLQPWPDGQSLLFDGDASNLISGLQTLSERMKDRPVAGVLLFTDGNATDTPLISFDASQLGFPIYPVLIDENDSPADLRIGDVAATQTDFETAPVTITVRLISQSLAGAAVTVRLNDETSGKLIDEQSLKLPDDNKPLPVTFKFRPQQAGVGFYHVMAFQDKDRTQIDSGLEPSEINFVNNHWWLNVDRGHGPHRILYVSGRPNWDFKFLRRALQNDPETRLVGLLRLANKEAKFSFRDREVTSTNPLFAGLGEEEEDGAQQADEAVMVRLGIEENEELSSGFPTTPEELFSYKAIILDDIEADFFTQDQLQLLRRFVAVRGGGLLLMGGVESFDRRRFAVGPLAELSPIYPAKNDLDATSRDYRFSITREGMLQPWLRLRETEAAEQQRLAAMPNFNTVNPTGGIKPGAIALATVNDGEGHDQPAMVMQRFGSGKTAAMMLADSWRWPMRRKTHEDPDAGQFWRQVSRWLVNDVPQRVQVRVQPATDQPGLFHIETQVLNEMYLPLDNARVTIEINRANPSIANEKASMSPVQSVVSSERAGQYDSSYFTRETGGFLVTARVVAQDGAEIGVANAGWSSQPGQSEFRSWQMDRRGLEHLASTSGGEVIDPSSLESFTASLQSRKVPVTERWRYPLWHQPWVMLMALICLCTDWGLRRLRGFA